MTRSTVPGTRRMIPRLPKKGLVSVQVIGRHRPSFCTPRKTTWWSRQPANTVSTNDQKDDRSSIPSDQTVSKGQKEGRAPSHNIATPANINNAVSTNDQRYDSSTLPLDNTGHGPSITRFFRMALGRRAHHTLGGRWYIRSTHNLHRKTIPPKTLSLFSQYSVSIYKPFPHEN